ncbi:hypothetical protein GO986_09060 [Deinococcus sp. HMF7620]|uniref:Uncharacterized protein n=1 Tax=Deinococcus arboris TaxID=2682977 RepID=A0A7C9HRK8_9DEIO|nr:hypothetical protein [Deinococcus arboris]MVN86913.1 hypothetical protein [Deinococcus arboris]
MSGPILPPPTLSIGGVGIPTGHLPPMGSVTADWEAQAGEDPLLSGLFAGQVSQAGATAATLNITSPEGFWVPHPIGTALEAIRPGQLLTLTETYTRPDTARTWTNCEVLTAAVRPVGLLPGRVGAWYSYAFTLRWRKAN